ncbi:RCC1 domain-containing protein 1 [Tamandua tetradactyla]|uniref:RCC1 domain-containing protein 1 n=1 Tax=Tamandua tetradactyla TaxID=48850 RepID=UPI004053888D
MASLGGGGEAASLSARFLWCAELESKARAGKVPRSGQLSLFLLNLVGARRGRARRNASGTAGVSPLVRWAVPRVLQVRLLPGMAEERPGAWYGFGFCGFGQAPGSGRGRQVHGPELLGAPVDTCRVSASWSYTAYVTRAGRAELAGAASGAAGGCADAWASEALLAVLRARPGPGPGAELQIWTPGSALRGKPLWSQPVESGCAEERGSGGRARAPSLPLLPGGSAYVSPRAPFFRPLAPGLRARRLELGAEHALLLDAAGQVFSWGGGRHGQLGHGTLEAEPEPRLLEALQGLPVAEVAAGGWHSVCVSEAGDVYSWGWNEAGQLALPSRSLAEDGKPVSREALHEDGSEGKEAGDEEGAPSPFVVIQPFPALLDLPRGSEAAAASCGSRHTAVVTRMGELYTWGWGKYGQLGHEDLASVDHPCRVEFFVAQHLRVQAVACGPWSTCVYAAERGES